MARKLSDKISAKATRGYQPLIPQETALISGYKPVQIVVCRACERVFKEKRWTKTEQTKELELRVQKNLIPSEGVSIDEVHVDVEPDQIEARKGIAIATVIGTYNGAKLQQEYDVPFFVNANLCSACSKNNELYYEGALQLRAVTPQIFEATLSLIKDLALKGVFANKVEQNGEGNYDIRISSQKYIKVLGLALQKRFGGSIQNDAKLFSYDKQTSRNIYRVNVTYTAVPFAKHDIITNAAGDFYSIDAISKHIHARNLDTGAPQKFDAIQLRAFSKVAPVKVTVSKYTPSVMVLHPQTYQETPLLAVPGTDLPQIKTKIVKVFVIGSRLFYNS